MRPCMASSAHAKRTSQGTIIRNVFSELWNAMIEPNSDPSSDGKINIAARRRWLLMVERYAHADDRQPGHTAIVLVAVEGLTVKAAADMMGCSEGAIEQRLVRARSALRKEQRERKEGEASDGGAQ